MSEYVFSPSSPAAAPIRGQAQRFPIRRIFCVGRNYEAHAKEMGGAVDREAPFYFTKAAEHYVAVGRHDRLSAGDNELSLRDGACRRDRQGGIPRRRSAGARACVWLCLRIGHDAPRSPVGREREAAARGISARTSSSRPCSARSRRRPRLAIQTTRASSCGSTARPNRSSDISQLIHNVPAVIAHLSQYYHLQPGDLIYTGTPEGVGPVKPGDRLEDRLKGSARSRRR